MIPEPPLIDLTGATCYIRGSIYMTHDKGRTGGTQKAGENHSVFILTSTGNQFSFSCFHSSRGPSVCHRQVTRDGRGGAGGKGERLSLHISTGNSQKPDLMFLQGTWSDSSI